ncbi:MAG: hypothetical protein IIB00_00300 [candidate division Zixibacteria bacterium]|nr:hypothetical protein [candidate division Zixibacteria bacterium]
MDYLPLENVSKFTRNRYEAVIVTSQHARHLNLLRLAQLQRMLEEDGVEPIGTKVTTLSLKDLLKGEIVFHRNEDADSD